jgi:hypothetical protein
VALLWKGFVKIGLLCFEFMVVWAGFGLGL